MSRFSSLVPWCVLAAAVVAAGAAEPAKPPSKDRALPRMGMNLSGPADWNTELPFVDVFRMSRHWISQQEGRGWGQGPKLDLDPLGWVRSLPPGVRAETLMCTIERGHYPAGDYTVLYRGQGRLSFGGSVIATVSEQPGRTVVRVDPKRGPIHLRIEETLPSDYVRDLHVVMPGFEATYRSQVWHPTFLARWKGMDCLRFMDFQETNNSKQRRWSDRPTPEHATFSERGIPIEWLIDLANRLEADAWFCIPHQADDDYATNFARLAKERLSPKRRAWVEYSNEVWNGSFRQHAYAAEEGRKLELAEKPWEAAWRFTAVRSVALFDIWSREFGDPGRVVRVLPSQAANPYVSEQILAFRDAGKHADVLAIAPYFGFSVSPAPSERVNASVVAGWTVDQVLDHIEKTTLPEAERWIADSRKVADRYGLKLVAYEAGQHLVGIAGAENDAKLTALFHAANRHPRMQEIYTRYLDRWAASGGDLICNFSSVGAWSKWGSWGLLEHYDDDEAASPKFAAVKAWTNRHRPPPSP
ncbi:MAG: hypothetical protein JNL97_06320 [Verrucomicrobiales bacterium]|nr:hypothetical protein [Verrucomicrobiales bacterium]